MGRPPNERSETNTSPRTVSWLPANNRGPHFFWGTEVRYTTRAAYRAAWEAAYEKDPDTPLNVDIELASACNARCTFCLYGDRDWVAGMSDKDFDGKPKKRLMPKELAKQIIDECANAGIPSLKFNFRGESLIHPDFGEILEHAYRKSNCGAHKSTEDAAQYCLMPFWDLLSNTNANIPPALWESSISGLMKCTKVMVSLDSMDPEIYPKVRVGLSLDSAIKTINELVCRGHQDLWVRRVVCKANKSEDFAGAVRARWPKGLRVSEHYAFDRNPHYGEQQIVEDVSTWERTFCGYPQQRVVIEASGRYSACCIAWEGELSGGTYPAMSIMEYWNSPWRKKLSQELKSNIFSNAKCQSCTSYLSYKRPERAFVQDVEAKA